MPPGSAFHVAATWNSSQVKAALSALAPKQWAFATSLALNTTATTIKTDEVGTMKRVFDRPTPFTLNSLRLARSTKTNLEARVWFKDPPRLTEREHFLLPQVYGGERPQKRFEQTMVRAGFLPRGKALVPTSAAPLDAYGNVSRGIYSKILADLHASPIGATRNPRKRAASFFYSRGEGLKRGIWQRSRGGRVLGGRMGGSIMPIFLETRMPRYRARFAFFDVAEKTASRVYESAFAAAADRTLRTAR